MAAEEYQHVNFPDENSLNFVVEIDNVLDGLVLLESVSSPEQSSAVQQQNRFAVLGDKSIVDLYAISMHTALFIMSLTVKQLGMSFENITAEIRSAILTNIDSFPGEADKILNGVAFFEATLKPAETLEMKKENIVAVTADKTIGDLTFMVHSFTLCLCVYASAKLQQELSFFLQEVRKIILRAIANKPIEKPNEEGV